MIISKFDIIKSKKTDAFSNLDKIKAWSEITTLFNSQRIIQKTTEQLKNIFKNKKCDIRKDLAADNAERFITGGGPYKQRVSDSSPFLAFVQQSCTPQSGVVDSDTPVHPEPICVSDEEDDYVLLDNKDDQRNTKVITDASLITPEPSTSFFIKKENQSSITPASRKIPISAQNTKKRKFEPIPSSRASKILKSEALKDDIFQKHKKLQDTKQKILDLKLQYWEKKIKNINNITEIQD